MGGEGRRGGKREREKGGKGGSELKEKKGT